MGQARGRRDRVALVVLIIIAATAATIMYIWLEAFVGGALG